MAVLLTSSIGCNGGGNEASESQEEQDASDSGQLGDTEDEIIFEEEEEPPSDDHMIDGLVWVVKPTFDYDGVGYCPVHESFFAYGGAHIDSETGKETGQFCGHGGGWIYFFYDAELDVYGVASGDESGGDFNLYSEYEMEQRYQFFTDKLNFFIAFDSTIAEEYDDDSDSDYFVNEAAWQGKSAVAFGTKPVTDFVYDGGESNWRRYNDIVAVQSGDKWGLIDKKGKVVFPFVLEDAISIDNTTAFAKYNGYFGILRVPGV